MRRPFEPIVLATLVGVTSIVAACADSGPSGTAFCRRLVADQALVVGVGSAADVDAAVATYQELGALAPLAIREPWQNLTDLVEQAAAIDPSQADARALLQQLAYASQSAADDVSQWTEATCGIALRTPTLTTVPAAGSTAPPAPAPSG